MNTKDQTIKIMGDVLGLRPKDLDPSRSLKELVDDSFMLVEMIVALKDHFKLNIPATELESINTVGDLIDFVSARVDAAGGAAGKATAKAVAKK